MVHEVRRCTKPGAGERILRMIVSDHGHGSSNGRVFVNKLLMEWGYLKPLGSLSRVSRKITLLTLDATARREKNRELQVDWSQTKAYLAHVGIYGFVYVNLKGREPNGCVSKKEFEKLLNMEIEKVKSEFEQKHQAEISDLKKTVENSKKIELEKSPKKETN